MQQRENEALRESRELLRVLFDRMAVGIAWTDLEGRFAGANPVYRRLLGYTAEELVRLRIRDVTHEDDWTPNRVLLEELAAGRRDSFQIEKRCRRKDGRLVWVRNTVSLLPGADGKPAHFVTIVEDITEIKGAEEALKQSQQQYHDIFEHASVGIFRSTLDGRLLVANSALARILGYESPDELRQCDLAEDVYLHKDERAALITKYEPLQTPYTLEVQWKQKDGTPIWVLLNARAVKDDVGRTVYFEGFVQDITQRKRAVEELARSRKQLRDLAGRLQAAREAERTLMAREIHDELGQTLTALKMELHWLSNRMAAQPGFLSAKVHEMTAVVDKAINTVRRLATELRPPMLDDLGLVAAVEWQAQQFALHTGVHCTVKLPDEPLELDRERSTAVFRILQEALTNVARHAGASRVDIGLSATPKELTLEVRDDGRGITEREISSPKALGLLGMRERASVLGGTVTFQGNPRDGTVLRLSVPHSRAEDEPGAA